MCARAKTPVLSGEETRHLLDSIDRSAVVGLRDRALLGVMVYSFARVGAVVAMDMEDYYQSGRRGMFRLHEKGGKEHVVPAHTTPRSTSKRTLTLLDSGCRRRCPSSRP